MILVLQKETEDARNPSGSRGNSAEINLICKYDILREKMQVGKIIIFFFCAYGRDIILLYLTIGEWYEWEKLLIKLLVVQ